MSLLSPPLLVIPAKAGIQGDGGLPLAALDPGFRRDDGWSAR